MGAGLSGAIGQRVAHTTNIAAMVRRITLELAIILCLNMTGQTVPGQIMKLETALQLIAVIILIPA